MSPVRALLPWEESMCGRISLHFVVNLAPKGYQNTTLDRFSGTESCCISCWPNSGTWPWSSTPLVIGFHPLTILTYVIECLLSFKLLKWVFFTPLLYFITSCCLPVEGVSDAFTVSKNMLSVPEIFSRPIIWLRSAMCVPSDSTIFGFHLLTSFLFFFFRDFRQQLVTSCITRRRGEGTAWIVTSLAITSASRLLHPCRLLSAGERELSLLTRSISMTGDLRWDSHSR